MRMNVANLDEYTEPAPLGKGRYFVVCTNASGAVTSTGRDALQLNLEIIDGPELTDGTSPAGRRLIDRLIMPAVDMKDGGKFCGVKLHQTCKAFGVSWDETGFDNEDFVGQEAIALLRPRKDNPEQTEVTRYLATD